jgi:hypothetical protein
VRCPLINEGSGVFNTDIREYSVSPAEVYGIFNQDHGGYFSGATVVVQTRSDIIYEVYILKGGVMQGTHRGRSVPVRKVNYRRLEAHHRPVVAMDQYAHFTGPIAPRIHFHTSLTEDEDAKVTGKFITPRLLRPKMGLVIDWNEIGA